MKKKKTAAAKAKLKTTAVALLTAAQIEKNCPASVEGWGNQIKGHYKTALQYEGKAEQQWNSIGRYLAQAKAACDGGGFAAFRERFCPDLGKTRVYELLRIGSGKTTTENLRAATAGRMKKHRAAQKAAAEQEPKLVRHVTEDPAASAERRKAEYAMTDETVRLNGGQAIDIEKLSPAAQAQLAEKLLPVTAVTSAEERKAAIERGEHGTFLTDAEFKALTADELRELIGNLFFGNADIANFDDFMGMTADELRDSLEGVFGGDFCGVLRDDDDGNLSLYYGDGNLSAATESDVDPLFVINDMYPVATAWLAAQLKPIWDGSIKNDEAKSASALAQFKRACAKLLPQMTVKDLESVADLGQVVWDLKIAVEDAERAADDAKRIKREAKNPERAKDKAREQAQAEVMENDMEDAKNEAKEDGKRWGDLKDQWVDEWIAENWEGSEAEEQFEKDFNERWAREHGSNFPHRRKNGSPATHPRALRALWF
jgi:hypothetical protein